MLKSWHNASSSSISASQEDGDKQLQHQQQRSTESNARPPSAAIGNTDTSRGDGCFAFCRLGNNTKRSEQQKQLAKIERALNTALFVASCHASVKCAERLLELGADATAAHHHDDDILGWCSPLISACAAPITSNVKPVCSPDVAQVGVHVVRATL